MNNKNEYSVSRVAEMLRVPIATVRSWIFSGKLKSVKRVGRRYISRNDLLTFINENNVPMPDELK